MRNIFDMMKAHAISPRRSPLDGSANPEKHDMYVMRKCVKAWLTEARLMMFEQEALADRIREMDYKLDGLCCDPPGARTGAGMRGLDGGIARLMAMKREWSEMVTQDIGFIKNAIDLCRPRHKARYACWLHWGRGLSWSAVARRLNYSVDHAKSDVKDKGVEELYPLIPEEFRRYTFPNAAPEDSVKYPTPSHDSV